MSGWKLAVALAIALALGSNACVSDLDNERASFAFDHVQRIQRGMTKDEVVFVIGRPHHMVQQEVVGDKQVIAQVWTWFDANTQTTYLVGFGVDDRVVKTDIRTARRRR